MDEENMMAMMKKGLMELMVKNPALRRQVLPLDSPSRRRTAVLFVPHKNPRKKSLGCFYVRGDI
jgi:hypothetical protein